METGNSWKPFRARRLGEPRKKSQEIRVDSWDKIKPSIVFKGENESAWCLTKNKEYPVLQTKLISSSDDNIQERGRKRYDTNKIFGLYGHQMRWFFQIINDKGNKKNYPQSLFAIRSDDA